MEFHNICDKSLGLKATLLKKYKSVIGDLGYLLR